MTTDEVSHFDEDEIDYHVYSIEDRQEADILSLLPELCLLIENRLHIGSVLVHCNFGVSRSASVCIAFKGKYDKLSMEEALASVKNDRNCISPNDGFIIQLHDFLS
mmetsp:Transcript_33093/g.42544  ORF Transcript_33093/g.42544 Transcript_33093/m.42544 type:complete len:106 (-) Transcript_33093:98-415(-)